MYFLRRLRPLDVAGERVRSLRVSLNAPVLTTPDLPAGPGRAVIVVHREARGKMDATVGVRSVATGEIAYWSFDGDLLSEADLSVAADAALTFAESLGFLFEEAPIAAGAAAAKAFRAWSEGEDGSECLVQPAEAVVDDDLTDSLFSDDPQELEIEDLMANDSPLRAAPSAPDAPPAPSVLAAAREPQATLSKFRARGASSALAPTAAGPRKPSLRQPLARVQLVKRRSPEDERKLTIRRLHTVF